MISKILVPVDLHGASVAALRVASAIALRQEPQAELELLHVVERELVIGATNEIFELLESNGRKALETCEEVLRKEAPALVYKIIKKTNSPVEAILERSEECSLTVMGTHGMKGFERFVIGSVAEGVMREARKPVVAVRFDGHHVAVKDISFDTIVLPYDGSKCANKALQVAPAISKGLGAKKTIVMMAMDKNKGKAVQDVMWERGRDANNELKARGVEGLALEVVEGSGHPADEIVQFIKEHQVHAAVMSTHGRRGFNRMIMGSATEGVLRQMPSYVPLFTVGKHLDAQAYQ